MTNIRALLLVIAFAGAAMPALAQPLPEEPPKRTDVLERTPSFDEQVRDLKHALAVERVTGSGGTPGTVTGSP